MKAHTYSSYIMKIALVGPGILTIPPVGWGAVEILIWEYAQELTRLGHYVGIINPIRKTSQDSNPGTQYTKDIIASINNDSFDCVHIHYDCLYHILPYLTAPIKCITTHYPYLSNSVKWGNDGYDRVFGGICDNNDHIIFALCADDLAIFKNNALNSTNIEIALNGSNSHTFKPLLTKTYPNKSIYLAKVEPRKNQHIYYTLPRIDFYGNAKGTEFEHLAQFKGEVTRNDLPSILPNYGNLVLLSSGEGTPLVLKEALMCGIPAVVSECCVQDFDTIPDFIDVVPDSKRNDLDYVADVIACNLKKQFLQETIRSYAMSRYDWHILTKKYTDTLENRLKYINK